jgi:hypothetical protein
MIIALAEKEHDYLFDAWRHLMRTRFQIPKAENCQVVDLTKDYEVIELTDED